MSVTEGSDSFTSLSDIDIKRIAAEHPPEDPRDRAALVAELNRRAGVVRTVQATGLQHQKVIVTDIEIPFGSMVGFMVKWASASIPALIILSIIGSLCVAVLAALGSAMRHSV
jgi:hypothetical protein